MKAKTKTRVKRAITRALVIVPPILFVAYAFHGLVQVRGLLGRSVAFHLNFANDLVQDFLELDIALETQLLENRLLTGKAESEGSRLNLVTTQPSGPPLGTLSSPDGELDVYLKRDHLSETLPAFFESSKGLNALYAERYHEPVYWFRIINEADNTLYQSGNQPNKDVMATYDMERTLKGHRIQIVYNSFGPTQLYSVARTKVNFGGLLLLFALAVLSAVLLTHSIRQKIVLARQKTFFVSTVSHEFKTPLAIMKLAAETLEAKRFRTPEEEQRFRNMLHAEINRLNHLVHKILNFNKIEMGQVHYQPRRIDLRDALKQTLEVFQAQAVADGVTLKVALDERPCLIDGDPDLIRHAVDNILDNAFKYRGDSKLIELSCSAADNEVRIKVRDQGIGIPEDDLPHIQKSFYRVHDPILQGVRGSGLGLAITNHILTMAGGRLDIESEHGKGSSFTLIFSEAQAA